VILYADVLFLVNLSMDFLTIYIASRLTHAKPSIPRTITASVLGALYGTGAVIFSLEGIIAAFCSAALSVLTSVIAFGIEGGVWGLLRQSLMVWGCGALLGGIMSAFMAMGEPVYLREEGAPSYAVYYILTFAAAVLLVRVFSARSERQSAEVEVNVYGERFRFSALCDSGNLMRDPLCGAPVILVSPAAIGDSLRAKIDAVRHSEGDFGDLEVRFRLIPHKSVDGSGIFFGFVPDEVRVDGVKKRAVIALDEKEAEGGYAGFSGIVPSCLCK